MNTLKARTATLALSAGFVLMAGSAQAETVQCGSSYTVVAGDSLSAIANDAYGSPRDFQIIYSANAEAIGRNPSVISVGLELEIPCVGGELEASTADTSAIRTEVTTEALPAPSQRTIRFVTGTDWAPFTNEDQDQGGMIVEIANVAMANATGEPDYQIDFINDWGAHLQPLISDHAYDFSLAWFRPNCDNIERLGEGSQFRCNNLRWSEPLFEQIVGYYTLEGAAVPASYADLSGQTVCRPAGYATFMLEENDLVEPNVSLVRPNAVADCFIGLRDGTVDVVVLASDTAEGAISELGLNGSVVFNEPLSQVLTMHAVISSTHPHVDEYLDTFNSGVVAIKDNGEWFSIVRRHLIAYRSQTQS